jgi:hypothetical protein
MRIPIILILLAVLAAFIPFDIRQGNRERGYQARDRLYTETIGQTIKPVLAEDLTLNPQDGLKLPVLNKGPTV